MKLSCFNIEAEILMQDGKYKKIGEISSGELVALGGEVRNIKQAKDTELYQYGNLKVQGDQAVFENEQWVLVKNSKKAYPIGVESSVVCFIETDNHLIVTRNMIWADILGSNNLDYEIEVLNQNKPRNVKLKRFIDEYFEEDKNILKEIKTPF
jgi:hypothetical protein